MSNIAKQFIGVWRLISCSQTDPDGQVSYPWGADAIGYIIYMSNQIMAVQIMRPNRALFIVDDFMLAQAEECHTLPQNYNAYFGTYEIDEAKNTVIHHIQGHLFPNLVGKDNIRQYHFDGNRLLLTTVGSNIKRDMLWERVTAHTL
ncbi:MAG TPA: lipocalin-like domain-containing protein [Gammaproteobacteria bacterium]|nr:lipocalin-like domain-containing protein [Gammaproteobacteria bacterium]